MHATINEVKEKLTKKGYDFYEASLGVNGVRLQFDNNIVDNIECISQ